VLEDVHGVEQARLRIASRPCSRMSMTVWRHRGRPWSLLSVLVCRPWPRICHRCASLSTASARTTLSLHKQQHRLWQIHDRGARRGGRRGSVQRAGKKNGANGLAESPGADEVILHAPLTQIRRERLRWLATASNVVNMYGFGNDAAKTIWDSGRVISGE